MLEVQNLQLKYGDRVLFDKCGFRVNERDRVGVVGRNGAGKSTLFRILMDKSKPDSGSITLSNEETIAMLGQELEVPSNKSVLDTALEAYDDIIELETKLEKLNEEVATREDYTSDSYAKLIDDITSVSMRIEHHGGQNRVGNAEKVLKGLGFKQSELENLVNTLSGGWQMRVELAKLLLKEPTFLLLDEPTNHLDIESILWLEKYFETYPGAVLIISHDVMFLENTCSRILDIELGKIRDYKYHYKKYLEQKALIQEQQMAAFENQQKEIKQKEVLIDRFRAKASKAKMAQSLIKQLDKIDRIEVEKTDGRQMNIRFLPFVRSALHVLKARHLSKSYDDNHVLEDVNFQLERGDRVAFVGQNGQGKSTLVKLLLQRIKASSGEVEIGNNAQIAYYAQNQADSLDPSMTLLETMEEAAPEEMRTKVRGILGSFLFPGEEVDKKVSVLSGGERARLALAKLVLRPINLLVLDEPTNHLDIIAKDVLKEALNKFEGTLLVVSHDREFLSGLTNTVYEFRDRKIHTYLGDINYFLEKRAVDNMREVELRSKEKKEKPEENNSKQTHEERKVLKNKIRNIERTIESKEEALKKLESELLDPDVFKSDRGIELQKEHGKIKEEIQEATASWEVLVTELGD